VNQSGSQIDSLSEDSIMDLEETTVSLNDEILSPLDTDVKINVLTPQALIPTLSCILGTIFLLFSEPIISDHLISLGLSSDHIGYVFAASCLAYALMAPIVGYLIQYFSKERLSILAYFLSTAALLI